MATLADRYIQRAQRVLRAAEGEANDAALLLDKTNARIMKMIRASKIRTTTKEAISVLERRINKELIKYYGDVLPAELLAGAAVAVASEVTFNVSVLTGEQAREVSIPKNEEIVRRTARKTYQGKRFSTWTNREFSHNSQKINGVLRDGFVKSKPLSEIEDEVAGITNRSRRDVRTIVRSSFTQNAQAAKDTVYNINPDIIEGAIWVSVLDNRTTPHLCGERDGYSYDNERNPIDGGPPWDAGPGELHWNCRSTSIPRIIGVNRKGERASVDAGYDYKRGDNKNPRGSVRKPIKKNREKGIFEINQHTTRTKYEGWLRTQSKKNIDYVSDVLGSKKKAQLFREGASLKEIGLSSPVASPLNRKTL